MQRRVAFAPGEYFHIYNRGANKAKVFLDGADYQRFLLLLYLANNTEVVHLSNLDRSRSHSKNEPFSIIRPEVLVDIGVYCIMPNHFHLLVRSRNDIGVSIFMKKLLTGYAMYFNKRHEHSGALFEGRFKAEHVANDRYLKYLFSYIHLNPLSLRYSEWKEKGIPNIKGAEEYLHSYRYSSFLDYAGVGRSEKVILTTSNFPDYFREAKDFKSFILDWLKISSKYQGRSLISMTDLDIGEEG